MKLRAFYIATIMTAWFVPAALAAPKADLWPVWERHQPKSTTTVDHGLWQAFLDKYVSTNPDGINVVDYANVSPADRAELERYVSQLEATRVFKLNRQEQLAYWINLYNVLTIQVILDHMPVDSIKEIDISPGFLSNGPWGAKLAGVEGHEVSLNDIEHRILRPIWKDNRIHYAVNCASYGCPNLSRAAFTGENAEQLLDRGAREFVNHPRGARFEDGELHVSSIYDWYQVDFGDSDEGVIAHLRRYASGELARRLADYDDGYDDDYNWDLNAPRR